MRETPYKVAPSSPAVLAIARLPTITERALARQKLIDREPYPARFATYTEAKAAATKAGPEFEVVVQS